MNARDNLNQPTKRVTTLQKSGLHVCKHLCFAKNGFHTCPCRRADSNPPPDRHKHFKHTRLEILPACEGGCCGGSLGQRECQAGGGRGGGRGVGVVFLGSQAVDTELLRDLLSHLDHALADVHPYSGRNKLSHHAAVSGISQALANTRQAIDAGKGECCAAVGYPAQCTHTMQLKSRR